MPTNLNTPGVYIEEINPFPNEIVPVESAVPCFIGFTEKAERRGTSLINQAIKITSFVEYLDLFGGAPEIKFEVAVNGTDYKVMTVPKTVYYLYHSLKLYFQNGGGACYIYSVGNYSGGALERTMVDKALEQLKKEEEPTILLLPDGQRMTSATEYYNLVEVLTDHCKTMVNRFALFDIYDGNQRDKVEDPVERDNMIQSFRNGVSGNHMSYGATYWPWLETTIVEASEISFTQFLNFKTKFIPELKKQVPKAQKDLLERFLDNLGKKMDSETFKKTEPEAPADPQDLELQNKILRQFFPAYKVLISEAQREVNILPTCGAIAGIYCSVDNARGVWQAPANVPVSSVVKPLVAINNSEQEDLNVPLDGKAVNAIRSFTGRGTLVWGARTLDGNSTDFRYVPVRRTLNVVEASIRIACKAYVFEPNDRNTWKQIEAMVSNYLTNLWGQGGLAGAKPSDAFNVSIGLGSTMTADDILNGRMRVTVLLALTRPAEFVSISFEQEMARS